MAQWMKTLVTEYDGLSSVSGTHMVGKNQFHGLS